MNQNFIFLFSLFLCIWTSSVLGQTKISGNIKDADTRVPLAFVHIVYNQQNQGVTTDLDGNFRIETNESVEKIRISYIGYSDTTIIVDSQMHINIELNQQTFAIDEVTVYPGENPAHRIINNVIKNRDINNPEKMRSFSYSSYNKMVFDVALGALEMSEEEMEKDTTESFVSDLNQFLDDKHLLLMESVSERNFMYPDRNNEQVLATKVSGFKDPLLTLLATQMQSFSFYDSHFNLLDKAYVNPISKGSTNKYFFLLEDTLYNQSKDTIFIISFKPKAGKIFDGLVGFLHVNTNKYAIENVIAEPTEDLPTLGIKIQQKYEFIDNTQWFPTQLNTDLIFKTLDVGTKENSVFVTAMGKSYLTDIVLNPELDKKDFSHIALNFTDSAHIRSQEYINDFRHTPLSSKDTMTYHFIDSISKAENLDRKLKSLTLLLQGYIPYKWISFKLDKIIDYNNHEGYRMGLGVETNDRLSKHFSIGGYYAYGFRDKEHKYGGNLKLNLHEKSELNLNFTCKNDVEEIGGYSFLIENDFTSSEIYRRFMIKEMDAVESFHFDVQFRVFQYLKLQTYIQNSHISTLNPYSYQSDPLSALNTYDVTEVGVKFKYAFREKFTRLSGKYYSMGTKYPILYGNISQGINDLGGEYEYTKIELRLSKTFQTKSFGKTKISLVGGFADGDIPLSLLYNGHGSYSPFSVETENSFGTMKFNEFYSDRFAACFLKHDFGSFFRIKKWEPTFALIHNAGIGEMSNTSVHNNYAFKTMDKGYYEGGFLMNNILRSSSTGIGFGIFYRYGHYAYLKTAENFAYKFTVTFEL